MYMFLIIKKYWQHHLNFRKKYFALNSLFKCSYGNNSKISRSINHILPNPRFSRMDTLQFCWAGYVSMSYCRIEHVGVYLQKRTPTIKFARTLKSQISVYSWIAYFWLLGSTYIYRILFIDYLAYGLGLYWICSTSFGFVWTWSWLMTWFWEFSYYFLSLE